MKIILLKFLSIILAGLAIFFVSLGIYTPDLVYIIIGILLVCAILLIVPEIKNNYTNPYR